jgi:hypothetical protein
MFRKDPQVISATLGKSRTLAHPFETSNRPTGRDLVRRYAMWVHRCVMINAHAAANVKFGLFTLDSNGTMEKHGRRWGLRPASRKFRRWCKGGYLEPSPYVKAAIRGREEDLVEIETHDALELLQDVNAWESGYTYRTSIYADLQIFGRFFSHVLSLDQSGLPGELWRMLPQDTKVIPSVPDFVRWFEYGAGETKQEFDPSEVIWGKLYDPENPWGGLGPLEAWLRTVDASGYIADFQKDLMERRGVPDYLMITDKPLGTEAKRAVRSEWQRLFGFLGRRVQSLAFLGGKEARIERLAQTNRELEFDKSEDKKRDQIGQAFGVPKPILSTDDVNRANSAEAEKFHAKYGYWPLVQLVEDVFNEQLMPRYEGEVFLIHESPLPEDLDMIIKDRASKLVSGWSVDEVRTEEGAEALGTPEAAAPLLGAGSKPLERLLDPPAPPPMLEGPQEEETDEEEEPESETRALIALVLKMFEAKQDAKFTADQVSELLKAGAQRETVPVQVAIVQPETITVSDATKGELTTTIYLKDIVGDAADDSFDGYQNPAYADELQKAYDDLVEWIVKWLEGPTPVKAWLMKSDPTSGIYPEWPENRFVLDGFIKASLRRDPDDLIDEAIRTLGWSEEIATISERHLGQTLLTEGGKAIESVGAEISFNLENPRVLEYLGNVARKIGREQTDKWRTQIRGELIKGTEAGESTVEIAKRIRGMTDLTKAQSARVARTETAFASVEATDQGWDQSGVVVGKQFVLAPDACPWCEAVAEELGDGSGGVDSQKTIKLGQPMLGFGTEIRGKFEGKEGVEERTMVLDYAPDGENLVIPPVHPNCRCSLRPVLEGEI